MTLDLPKFIANTIRTQSKIHHFDINVKAVKKNDVPPSVSSVIEKDYGEKYMDDADYVAFFWGAIGKEEIKKLFNVVDKALGKTANKLTDKDFKKINISLDGKDAGDAEAEEADAEEAEVEVEDVEEDEPEELNEDEEEKAEVEVEDEDNDNDEDEEDVEVEVKEEKPEPPAKTSYFFLKITTK